MGFTLPMFNIAINTIMTLLTKKSETVDKHMKLIDCYQQKIGTTDYGLPCLISFKGVFSALLPVRFINY